MLLNQNSKRELQSLKMEKRNPSKILWRSIWFRLKQRFLSLEWWSLVLVETMVQPLLPESWQISISYHGKPDKEQWKLTSLALSHKVLLARLDSNTMKKQVNCQTYIAQSTNYFLWSTHVISILQVGTYLDMTYIRHARGLEFSNLLSSNNLRKNYNKSNLFQLLLTQNSLLLTKLTELIMYLKAQTRK